MRTNAQEAWDKGQGVCQDMAHVTVALMRAAFVDLWTDADFIRAYTNIVKSKPILVAGQEAQGVIAALGRVTPETRAFLLDYSNQLV